MWLAIDIGNTNIHIGLFDKDILHSTYSIKSTFPEHAETDFNKILNKSTCCNIQTVIISSVNPETEMFLVEYIQKKLSIRPKIVKKDILIPITIQAEQPEKVGTDRLINALAAFERTRNWTLVIDAGTAITIDVVNDKGAFVGGIIAPGIDISSKALHQCTSLLPEVSVKKPHSVIGKNTEEAINSGIYWGTIGMVNRIVNMVCDEIKCHPAIIATGGNANILAREIPIITNVCPNLTLEGIGIIYKKLGLNKISDS